MEIKGKLSLPANKLKENLSIKTEGSIHFILSNHYLPIPNYTGNKFAHRQFVPSCIVL